MRFLGPSYCSQVLNASRSSFRPSARGLDQDQSNKTSNRLADTRSVLRTTVRLTLVMRPLIARGCEKFFGVAVGISLGTSGNDGPPIWATRSLGGRISP